MRKLSVVLLLGAFVLCAGAVTAPTRADVPLPPGDTASSTSVTPGGDDATFFQDILKELLTQAQDAHDETAMAEGEMQQDADLVISLNQQIQSLKDTIQSLDTFEALVGVETDPQKNALHNVRTKLNTSLAVLVDCKAQVLQHAKPLVKEADQSQSRETVLADRIAAVRARMVALGIPQEAPTVVAGTPPPVVPIIVAPAPPADTSAPVPSAPPTARPLPAAFVQPWPGTWKRNGDNSTVTITGDGSGLSAEVKWTGSLPNQSSTEKWSNFQVTGPLSATCDVTGSYTDNDHDTTFKATNELSLDGDTLTVKETYSSDPADRVFTWKVPEYKSSVAPLGGTATSVYTRQP